VARGRDLTFSLLSDVDKFDVSSAGDDLEALGRDAADAGRDLDQLRRDAGRVDLDGTIGRDARDAADRVDTAFDKIARASRASSRKVEADTRSMRGDLDDVGEEAGSTAREMAASFSGSTDDVIDAFQELGANAGAAFGPYGVAAGVAASVGIGLVRAEAEKLRVMAEEFTAEMLENGGRITDAVVDARIKTMAAEDPRGFVKYNDAARALGVTIRDVTRARAGDVDAAARVIEALDALDDAQRDEARANGNAVAQRNNSTAALNGLRSELGLTAEATKIAEEAVATAATASAAEVSTSTSSARDDWDTLRGSMIDPITGEIRLRRPSRGTYAGIRRDLHDGIGPIIVDVVPNPRTDLFYPGRRRP